MNKNEFDAVIKMPAQKRYEYFIKKVTDYELVWGLYNDGWATTQDDAGNILIPFWPRKEFAEHCAINEWQGYEAAEIDLDEFINEWISGMEEDGNKSSIFWNNVDSAVMEGSVLLEDLNRELENY